jgi:uncharacterized membrane protein
MKNLLTNKGVIAVSSAVLGATLIGLGIDNHKAALIFPGAAFVLVAIVLGITLAADYDKGY